MRVRVSLTLTLTKDVPPYAGGELRAGLFIRLGLGLRVRVRVKVRVS